MSAVENYFENLGALLARTLDTQAENMERAARAEFFESINIDGGDEYNEALLEKYGKMIPRLA